MTAAGTGGPPGLAARRAALEAVAAVEERGAYSTLAVPAAVAALADGRDRALASHLAYDTLRWEGTLRWALGHVLDRDLGDVEPALARILRLGALQLLRTDIPPHAVVSTAAALAGEAVPGGRARGARGFVNGVLRALARGSSALPWPEDRRERLALHTGHPRWIVDELVERLGAEEAQEALEADNEPPGLTLRATGGRDELLVELGRSGLEAAPGSHAPEAVRVPGADPRRLEAVAAGRAVPQDEASMLVAHATGVAPGHRVLDLCAGPGGKTTHLAAIAGAGRVTALELHPHRARLVAQAAARVNVAVHVVAGDGTRPPLRPGFDTVLVDAPCTGLGTGRRRPEVRWRRDPNDVATLQVLQRQLLSSAVDLARPGGLVTYAACTWTAAETTGVVRAVRADRGDLELLDERQLWPHRDGTDGMYHATVRRANGPGEPG